MILALQFHPGDAAQALELTRLICDIEPTMRENDVFCISARRDVPQVIIDKMSAIAEEKFAKVLVIHGERRGVGWPSGANDVWAETMMRVSQAYKRDYSQTGVLTFEPDCVPLRADWIDALKEAWKATEERGKRVMGHAHGEPANHINGNAIFRIGLLREYEELNGSGNMGWDMFHRVLLMKIGEDTDLIYQHYGMRDYDRHTIESVRKNGVIPALFHGTKGMEAIKIVREMLNDGLLAKRSHSAKAKLEAVVERPKRNVMIRPHKAGFFSLVNNVATCCELFDNVEVDWRAPHYYDSAEKGDMWAHFFEHNSAKGKINVETDSFDTINAYPKWHLTDRFAAMHYTNPGDPWRQVYHEHWKNWRVRPEFVAKAEAFIDQRFGKNPFIALQARSSECHAGEQTTGKLQTIEEYEAAIALECKAGSNLGLYVAASDEQTAAHFVHRYHAEIYDETKRGANRSVDIHVSTPQTWKDAENVMIEVLILSRARALIHPVSNMATAALYMNPHLRSVYIP